MKSCALTVLLILVAGLSITAFSAQIEDLAQKPQPVEWTVPDCDHITGEHCVTFTADGGLTLARSPNMRFTEYCHGLAVLDKANTLLATSLRPDTGVTAVLLSTDAGCSWKEIAVLPVTYEPLYVTAAPGGGAYLWSSPRHWIYWFDGTDLHVRSAPDVIYGLAVDPKDAMHIRIGSEGCQIYESIDGGKRFLKVGVASNSTTNLSTVAFDPNDWDNALCGGFGASVTRDGGNIWSRVEPFNAANHDRTLKFVYSTDKPQRVYARVNIPALDDNDRYIMMSRDQGASFSPIVEENEWVPDQDGILRKVQLENWLPMAARPDNSEVLYFTYGFYKQNYGLDFYRYDADADRLTVAHTDGIDGVNSMVFHPTDPNIAYLGLKELQIAIAEKTPDDSRSAELEVTVSPNPFNPTANIRFSLPNAAQVKLEIFNIAGQRVGMLADRYLSAGEHAFTWDGSHVASGVYLYRLQAGETVKTEKMMLLK